MRIPIGDLLREKAALDAMGFPTGTSESGKGIDARICLQQCVVILSGPIPDQGGGSCIGDNRGLHRRVSWPGFEKHCADTRGKFDRCGGVASVDVGRIGSGQRLVAVCLVAPSRNLVVPLGAEKTGGSASSRLHCTCIRLRPVRLRFTRSGSYGHLSPHGPKVGNSDMQPQFNPDFGGV